MLHEGGGELEALALAPLEADVVPVGDLVLVDADGPGACVGAGVELGDAADGDAGLRDGVLGEGPHLLEHPLGGAHALADEHLVGALLAPARRLEALLLVPPPLHAEGLTGHHRRDRRGEQRPPRVHHPWVWCGLPACSVARRRGGGKRRRRKARVLGEEDEEMGVGVSLLLLPLQVH